MRERRCARSTGTGRHATQGGGTESSNVPTSSICQCAVCNNLGMALQTDETSTDAK